MAKLIAKEKTRGRFSRPGPRTIGLRAVWHNSPVEPVEEIQIRHLGRPRANTLRAGPLVPPAVPRRRPISSALAGGLPAGLQGRETILVVDENPLMREAVAANLRQLGYRVLEASDSLQAQHHAHSQRKVHMAIIDMPEPEIKRFELAQWFQAIYPETSLLLVTDWLWGLDLDLNCQRRVVVLAKPFTPLELGRMVRRVLNDAERAYLAQGV